MGFSCDLWTPSKIDVRNAEDASGIVLEDKLRRVLRRFVTETQLANLIASDNPRGSFDSEHKPGQNVSAS